MVYPVNNGPRKNQLLEGCTFERVFGSKIRTAVEAYGLEDPRARFFVCVEEEGPTAALALFGKVLVVSALPSCSPQPIADLVKAEGVTEVDTNWDQCLELQRRLGGVTESSYYMVYLGDAPEGDFSNIRPGRLEDVFAVLQQSHEYYRTHLTFETWSGELALKLEKGLMELCQLEVDGKVVGTGSIISEDEECGAIAAVAVIPEYRHRGLGSHITRYLMERICQKGKKPRLISGYDEVAELYRQLGFITCGRWGELYL